MQKIHLLLLLLFFSVGLSSNDKVEDKIAIILEETKVSFHKEKEGATEEEKKRSQASAVKLGETKLNRLRSFYLERH